MPVSAELAASSRSNGGDLARPNGRLNAYVAGLAYLYSRVAAVW